jgi:hypothetical protein
MHFPFVDEGLLALGGGEARPQEAKFIEQWPNTTPPDTQAQLAGESIYILKRNNGYIPFKSYKTINAYQFTR